MFNYWYLTNSRKRQHILNKTSRESDLQEKYAESLHLCGFDSLTMSTTGIAIIRVIILDIHTFDDVVIVDLS